MIFFCARKGSAVKGTLATVRNFCAEAFPEGVSSRKDVWAPNLDFLVSALLWKMDGHDEGSELAFWASFYGAKREHLGDKRSPHRH